MSTPRLAFPICPFFQMKDESVPTPSGSSGAQKLVTADGTYATQSAFSADVKPGAGKSKKEKVKNLVMHLCEKN